MPWRCGWKSKLVRACTPIDTLNCAYPGCTGMYLDVAGHMLAFYRKKTNPRAGLFHDQGVVASKAIANIPTWMEYFARWRVRCAKEQLLIKNGLLYRKARQGQADEIVFQFVVPQRHQGAALDGCHREAAHQGQRRSTTLMQER